MVPLYHRDQITSTDSESREKFNNHRKCPRAYSGILASPDSGSGPAQKKDFRSMLRSTALFSVAVLLKSFLRHFPPSYISASLCFPGSFFMQHTGSGFVIQSASHTFPDTVLRNYSRNNPVPSHDPPFYSIHVYDHSKSVLRNAPFPSSHVHYNF